MDLIEGYIYKSVPKAPAETRFFYRHKRKLGVLLTLAIHFGLIGWIFYRGVIAPFTDMAFIDDVYNDVKWIEITKVTQPLKYPGQMLPQPGKVVPLDQLDDAEKQRQEELARKREQARRKREAEKRRLEEEKLLAEQEAERKAKEKQQQEDETAAANVKPEPPPAGEAPKFGLINARPIKEIIGKVYSVYKDGGLDIEKTLFIITLGFDVSSDGSLSNVRIIKSSGSQQIDASALNIASAISESHALMPLAVLSASTATLELGAERASLKISGDASTTAKAEDLAVTFGQQLSGLRLLMSFKNQDAATLLSHMEVFNQGTRLIADLTMSRADASAMMRKNFAKQAPVDPAKQPDAINRNLGIEPETYVAAR